MILPLHEMADRQSILSGVHAGRKLLAQLVAHSVQPAEPEAAYLDCTDVAVATGSFLRESVMAFRDYVRATLPNLYPVIANPSEAVAEELDFVLKHRRDAMWSCRLDADGTVSAVAILGELEAGHRATLDLVATLTTATAPKLAARSGASIGATAWNNRLAYLADRGLLVETRSGKTKTFTPVLENT